MAKYILILATLIFAACTPKQEPTQKAHELETTPQEPALTFSLQTVNKYSPSCATDSNSCATLELSVPQATGTAAADPINARITGALVQAIDVGDVHSLGLNEAIDTYIASYDSFLVEMKENDMEFVPSWSFELEGEVLFRDSQYVCISLPYYTYMGGAHPNSFTQLLTFDVSTGEEVDALSLVSDTVALKAKAAEAFRAARKLPADVDLQDEGFFWGGGFRFPENIGIVDEGLYFVYDPYEIAAYAMGPTEFVVKVGLK